MLRVHSQPEAHWRSGFNDKTSKEWSCVVRFRVACWSFPAVSGLLPAVTALRFTPGGGTFYLLRF
ncbi:hypothetical protein KEN37_004598 [Salmonella enterica]|nr:hypothetical protein [Salmonella enterica]